MVTVPQRITPLDWRTAIVNPNGTPNNYFIRLWQVSFVDQDSQNARIEALENAQLQAGSGIAITPSGHLLDNPTIAAQVQPILNQISTTQGAVLYRGATSWAALSPGTSGFFLQTLGPAANPQWAAGSGGTVTSVDGASSASGFTLTGGPITTSGTLTLNISSALNARASLGLVIGTDVQAFSSKLAAYAGGDTPSAFTLGIVDSVDAAAWRAAIGAGTSTVTPSALTKVDDTNVTMTLGGTPTTALLQATSLTLGWTGQLSLARGGTGASSASTAPWVQKAGDTMTGALNINLSGLSYTPIAATSVLNLVSTSSANINATLDAIGTGNAGFVFRRARGTVGAESAVQSGDILGQIIWFGFGASVYGSTAAIRFTGNATENWTNTAHGSRFALFTTPNGSTSNSERMGWEQNGDVTMSGAGDVVVDSNRLFRLRQYTVATLPTAGVAGRRAAVTDALAPTFLGVIVGGGAVNTPVYDDGTNWIAT